MPCIWDVPYSNHKAPWFLWQWPGKKRKEKKFTIKKTKKKCSKTKIFFFRSTLIWLHMRKNVFFKNSWNVFRWYMFKDSKKLATKKTQQQLALLHIKWQEREREGGGWEGGWIYKQTKKICTTTCFYLAVAAPAGLPGKAITWPLTLGERHRVFPFFFSSSFFSEKRTHSQAYKLFTLYYPAKLRKYTVAACWDFFFFSHYGKKNKQKQNKNRVHRNLERVQAKTVKNTGSNINTISAYTKWTLISNTILNTGGEKIVDHKCVFEHRKHTWMCIFLCFNFSLYIYIS